MSDLANIAYQIPPEQPRSRLTVVESIYYQSTGEDPTNCGEPFGRWLNTDEQPCIRRQKVGPEWFVLDLGWLNDKPISMVHITNLEGKNLITQPTDQQKTDLATRVIEIATIPKEYTAQTKVAGWILLPGETMRGQPAPGAVLLARCQHGYVRIEVTAYPDE